MLKAEAAGAAKLKAEAAGAAKLKAEAAEAAEMEVGAAEATEAGKRDTDGPEGGNAEAAIKGSVEKKPNQGLGRRVGPRTSRRRGGGARREPRKEVGCFIHGGLG